MSRIHEALKRAEQEKSANANARPAVREDAVRTTVEPVYEQPSSASRVSEEVVRQRHTDRPSDRGTMLRYEDLIARCTHPEWKADSTLRASLAGESGRV